MMTARKRERILSRLIEEEMRESFLDYSMSVIVQRALPDVCDGLKPVHRRILYAMYDLGLLPGRPYKKSASVVGEVLGKYHPHGDTAVYDSLVRMVQDFSLRYPLIDGQGNFGSIDGDSAAAYRYTEARLTTVAMDLLEDLGSDTVSWAPNFDNRLEEPLVLPAKLPNLLVNGSSGIAVGMSTNIPPHNLGEVAAAIRALVADPEISIAGLREHLPGPDFPTAGFIVGDAGIRDMYEKGRGRIVMRARIIQESLRAGRQQLVVTEFPFAVNKSKVVEQIAELTRKGKLEGIADLRDESDRDGIRVVIELKRGADVETLLRTLFKRTPLQHTFGAIMLALDNGQPREFTLKEMLESYRDHRLRVIERRTRFELTKAEDEYHITLGLITALDAIDEVISIIRESRDRPEASGRLQKSLDLSQLQAEAILNMRLGKLTGLETAELRERLAELETILAGLEEILGSEEKRLEILLEELDEVVERHASPRRTEILFDTAEDEVPVKSEMADEDVIVTLSHQRFVKRMPVGLYRRRVGSGKELAGMERYEDDWLERVFAARTQGWLLAFTAGGRVHFVPVLDLPESGRSSRGQSIYDLADADSSDPVIVVTAVDQLDDVSRHVISLSQSGLVKRTALSEFSHPRAGGVIAVGVKSGDRILDVRVSDEDAELLLLTSAGRAIRFPIADVPVMGRTARGVKGVSLGGGAVAVGMLVLKREATVLTMTKKGVGRRTSVDEFPVQKRGGLGTIAVTLGSGGELVGALEVVPEDEVILVRKTGVAVQISASSVPLQGRRGKGKRVCDLGDDVVVQLTRGSERAPSIPSRAASGQEDSEEPSELKGAEDPPTVVNRLPPVGVESQLDLLGNEEDSGG